MTVASVVRRIVGVGIGISVVVGVVVIVICSLFLLGYLSEFDHIVDVHKVVLKVMVKFIFMIPWSFLVVMQPIC